MTEITDTASPTPIEEPSPPQVWRRFLTRIGFVTTASVAIVAFALSDLEAVAVAAGLGAGTFVVGTRRPRLGAAILLVISAVTSFFMSTAAFTNARAGSAVSATALSAGLAALTVATLIGAIGFFAARSTTPMGRPGVALGVAAVLFGGLMGLRLSGGTAEAAASDIALTAENVAFSDSFLAATAGEVTVTLGNEDLFWHTFTIDELGVDLRVPVGAALSASFEAPPGEYEFYCGIPGHPEAGMVGTLEITP